METTIRPARAGLGKGAVAVSDPARVLQQRGWDSSIVRRVIDHAPQRVLDHMLDPRVVPVVHHRGVATGLDSYDPHFEENVWALSDRPGIGWPLYFAFGKRDEGFLLRMQLPTLPKSIGGMVRPREEIPDDRLFIKDFGFLKIDRGSLDFYTNGYPKAAQNVKWVPYEKAVRQGLIRDLGTDAKARDNGDSYG